MIADGIGPAASCRESIGSARPAACSHVAQKAPGAHLHDLRHAGLTLAAQSGATLAVGKGESLLGHPLDAALWLVRNLNERGIRLKKGDLLSLGSLTPLLSLQSPERLDLEYEGLDPSGTVTVRVRFE